MYVPSGGKTTFYVATSYEKKDRANKLARALMDSTLDNFWPTFPWWMYSAEEDKHNKHMGAVGLLEIVGAAEADLFVWLYPARKGAWCELGGACYTNAVGRKTSTKPQTIIMVLPESVKDEYQPPFSYQPGIITLVVPDEWMDDTPALSKLIIYTYLYGEDSNEYRNTFDSR